VIPILGSPQKVVAVDVDVAVVVAGVFTFGHARVDAGSVLADPDGRAAI